VKDDVGLNGARSGGQVQGPGWFPRARWACPVGLVLVCLAASGCGYSLRRPFPQNVRTVYVEMFQSREFRRGLEFTLTEALQKRILQDTPYKIADKNTADTMITGEVLEVRQNTLGRNYYTGQPRQTQATFVIRFQWKDMRNGQILVDQPRFMQSVEYIPPAGQTFDNAADKALDALAERIVEQMMSPW
jgi:hypothetical protein